MGFTEALVNILTILFSGFVVCFGTISMYDIKENEKLSIASKLLGWTLSTTIVMMGNFLFIDTIVKLGGTR